MKFEAGEIAIIHSLPETAVNLNGEECTVLGVFFEGRTYMVAGQPWIATYSGYVCDTSFGVTGIKEINLKKRPPENDGHVTQIWSELIHRLTEGVPA